MASTLRRVFADPVRPRSAALLRHLHELAPRLRAGPHSCASTWWWSNGIAVLRVGPNVLELEIRGPVEPQNLCGIGLSSGGRAVSARRLAAWRPLRCRRAGHGPRSANAAPLLVREDPWYRISVFPIRLPGVAGADRGHQRAGDALRAAGAAAAFGYRACLCPRRETSSC
jgi:hypothetical protein